MTFSSMESSEMPQETESNEVQETEESFEASEPLDQVTFNSEEKVALEGSYEQSEEVEAAFVEVMKAAVTELPEPVAEKGDDPGDGPMPPYDPGDADPDKSSIGVPGAGGDVMIDTVPLPEEPLEMGGREKIGTWPTPEEPSPMKESIQSDIVDRVAIIDSNDSPRDVVGQKNRSVNEMEKLDQVSIIDTNDKPSSAVDDGPRSSMGDKPPAVGDTPPPPTQDSNNMEIPEDVRDGPPGSIDSGLEMRKAVDVADETSSLPHAGTDVPETTGIAGEGASAEREFVLDGDDVDTFDPGVKQVFDPDQENRIKNGYGSVAGTGGKEVSGEYQGGEVGIDDPRLAGGGDPFENFVDENGLLINPEKGAGDEFDPIATIEDMNKMDDPLGDVMGVMGEGNRPDPADLAAGHGLVSGPEFGKDGTDLQGAASPGADQRAAGVLSDIKSALNTLIGGGGSGDAGGDTGKQAETEELEAAGQAEEAANEEKQDFENEYNASKDGSVNRKPSTPGKKEVDAKLTAGLLWGRIADSKDTDPRGDGHAGVRTPDPDGGTYDSGYVEKYKSAPKDSELVEELKASVVPQREAPLDPVESMSQPVDDEAQDRERPVHLEESLDSSLDANINWGDDSSGGLSGTDKVIPSDFDADEKLVPPGGIDGEGGVEKPLK